MHKNLFTSFLMLFPADGGTVNWLAEVIIIIIIIIIIITLFL